MTDDNARSRHHRRDRQVARGHRRRRLPGPTEPASLATRIPGRTAAAVAALVAALLIVSGCNKNPPTDDGGNTIQTPTTISTTTSTPTKTPTTAPSPTGSDQQQILDTYLGMQHAFEKASETADPTYPDLPVYATGDTLTVLTDALRSIQHDGLRGRGTTVYHPRVESLSPATSPVKSRVRDCMDTAATQLYKADGSAYHDTPGGLRLVIADLDRSEGRWKVSGVGIHEVGSCVL